MAVSTNLKFSLFAAIVLVVGLIGFGASARNLVLAIGGEPEGGFDPVNGWGEYGHSLFQVTLLRHTPDLKIEGDLATSWKLSEDRMTWNITLREDARFSDGTPLVAEDVAYTFNAARDAGGLTDATALREARATGLFTLELHLHRPQLTFMRRMLTLGIVPAAGYGADYARAPVGAGPLRLVEWREGEQLVTEPNPYWHGGRIQFERISFVFGSEDAALALAQAGRADLVAVPAAQADSPPQGMVAISRPTVDNRGMVFPMIPRQMETGPQGQVLGNDVTSDLAIRQAINIALDREVLVDLALNGKGSPAFGPVDGLPWDNISGRIDSGDPGRATAILDAAGWEAASGNGPRKRDGVEARFNLMYPSSDSTRQALALGVADQLRGLGIFVTPQGRSWTEIDTLKHNEAVLFGWGAHDPQEIFNLYHSSMAGNGYFNAGFYRNPIVDTYLEDAQTAADMESSWVHWQAAQWDGLTGFGARGDAAWAWLVNLEHSYFVSKCLDLGPAQIHPHGHGFPITHNIANWVWTCE
ncbi:ABC transporter substrate-binding protein [Tabrizicola sp. WMC-M-20]|nr:ABC transporter substrate-binding protein [Tabrizicola sp. WMC-M-20]